MSQAAVVSAVSVSARSARANVLAERLERGAQALAILAASLTDAEWKTPIRHDGRTIGVVVHHVGTMYPLEIELAQVLASGQPVVGVTWAKVHEINAAHARDHGMDAVGALSRCEHPASHRSGSSRGASSGFLRGCPST